MFKIILGMIKKTKVAFRKSKRARKPTSFGSDFVTLVTDAEPQTFNEVIANPEAPF